MNPPDVSVVMPVYNRVNRVKKAVDSILQQQDCHFEFIIVDDGSSDGTLQVLEHYASQDSRIRLLALPSNGGQGLARALGNDAAEGRYIAVMDSDDIATPDRLTRQVHFMDAHLDITMAGANAIKVLPDGQHIQMKMRSEDAELKSRLLLLDGTFIHPTVMMRRDFLKKHNLNYSSERRGDDDYEFYTRMLQAGATFANMPDTLLEYHRHDTNISANSPRLEQDKLPLRRFLLGLFYPHLTGKEILSLALIMQKKLSISVPEACAGLQSADKALAMPASQFGEDHQVLNTILQQAVSRMRQAMKQQGLSV